MSLFIVSHGMQRVSWNLIRFVVQKQAKLFVSSRLNRGTMKLLLVPLFYDG